MTVQGTNQGRTVSTNVSVNVVVDLPDRPGPVALVHPDHPDGHDRHPGPRSSWPAATDPSSAIAGYEVAVEPQWRRVEPADRPRRGPARHHVHPGVRRPSYRFRVRAVDAAGNWSPWVEARGAIRGSLRSTTAAPSIVPERTVERHQPRQRVSLDAAADRPRRAPACRSPSPAMPSRSSAPRSLAHGGPRSTSMASTSRRSTCGRRARRAASVAFTRAFPAWRHAQDHARRASERDRCAALPA